MVAIFRCNFGFVDGVFCKAFIFDGQSVFFLQLQGSASDGGLFKTILLWLLIKALILGEQEYVIFIHFLLKIL